jgi:hypothetical protein
MTTLNKVNFKAVNAIKDEYDLINADDTKAVQTFRIRGAEAVNKLVAEYNPDNLINQDLIALVLGSMVDLQVRDYAMGITTAETLNKLNNLWAFLTGLAPEGFIAPVATLWAITHYEMGNTALAIEGLRIASDDDSEYSLTKLIFRVVNAGWSPESFQEMRDELHHKVVAGIYETN